MELDFAVCTGDADFRLKAFQSGSTGGGGGQLSCAFARSFCLPFLRLLKVPI